MTQFLGLLLFVSNVNAVVEWPFVGTEKGNVVEMWIGTPPQYIQAFAHLSYGNSILYLPSSLVKDDGFNPNASSTFEKTLQDDYFLYGNDDFVIKSRIGSSQQAQQKPFTVAIANWFPGDRATITFARSKFNDSFIEGLLRDQQEQVVVYTFDDPPVNGYSRSGLITVGGRPSSCGDPTFVEDVSDPNFVVQWTFELSSVGAGKFTRFSPGTAQIYLIFRGFTLPYDTYSSIAKQVGVYNDGSGQIDCDATVDLVFNVGGHELCLTPDDYIDRSQQGSGKCYFLGEEGSQEEVYTLPYTILRSQCFLTDFKNAQVGFANKH